MAEAKKRRNPFEDDDDAAIFARMSPAEKRQIMKERPINYDEDDEDDDDDDGFDDEDDD